MTDESLAEAKRTKELSEKTKAVDYTPTSFVAGIAKEFPPTNCLDVRKVASRDDECMNSLFLYFNGVKDDLWLYMIDKEGMKSKMKKWKRMYEASKTQRSKIDQAPGRNDNAGWRNSGLCRFAAMVQLFESEIVNV